MPTAHRVYYTFITTLRGNEVLQRVQGVIVTETTVSAMGIPNNSFCRLIGIALY